MTCRDCRFNVAVCFSGLALHSDKNDVKSIDINFRFLKKKNTWKSPYNAVILYGNEDFAQRDIASAMEWVGTHTRLYNYFKPLRWFYSINLPTEIVFVLLLIINNSVFNSQRPLYLYRACCFMEWCAVERPGTELHRPDRPASLFEGLSGRLYLAEDITRIAEARFPAFGL